jgi:hypothetical protein
MKDFLGVGYDFNKSNKENNLELLTIKDGRQDDYILFLRGITDFAETPIEILNRTYNIPNQSKFTPEEIKDLRNNIIRLQMSVKKSFAKEIIRFKSILQKNEKYKNAFNLKDIDWDKFISYGKNCNHF